MKTATIITSFTDVTLSKAQQSFFAEFETRTAPHLTRSKRRVWRDDVEFIVSPDDSRPLSGGVLLKNIRARTPARGHGAAGMFWLTELCDAYALPLSLYVLPLSRDENYLSSSESLMRWYERRGFNVVRADLMRRLPKPRL